MLTSAVMVGLLLAGCANDEIVTADQAPAGVTNEEQAIRSLAVADEFVANEEATFADKDVEAFDYGTFGKIDAAVTPLRFGRFITNVSSATTVTVQPGDSLAIARVEKTITGVLKIRARDGAGDTVLIEKSFVDVAVRNVLFKRMSRDVKRFWGNWVPVATSLVEGGTTRPAATMSITKLEVFLPNGETITVTEPTEYYLRYHWVRQFAGGKRNMPDLAAGDAVRIRATLVSSSPDTDVVALRYGATLLHRRRIRMALTAETPNADGTFTREYEATWPVHFHRGFFNAGIDAMTKGTLFDDQAAYTVSWWGVPYRVR